MHPVMYKSPSPDDDIIRFATDNIPWRTTIPCSPRPSLEI